MVSTVKLWLWSIKMHGFIASSAEFSSFTKMNIFLLFHFTLADYLKLYTDEKEFTYIDKHLNWTQAASSCLKIGAELATIDNFQEDNEVGNFLCSAHRGCKNWNLLGGVWLGYYLEQSEVFTVKAISFFFFNSRNVDL